MELMATLRGGPHDGKTVPIRFARQQTVVMPHPITVAEYNALAIDDTSLWMPPEDFYHRDGNGNYSFDRTVHYDPRQAQPCKHSD